MVQIAYREKSLSGGKAMLRDWMVLTSVAVKAFRLIQAVRA